MDNHDSSGDPPVTDFDEIVLRECPHCAEVLDHLIKDGEEYCTGCWAVDDGEEVGDCGLYECPDDATHELVYKTVGDDERRTEQYCEIHADMVAEDTKHGSDWDLFYGPRPIDEERTLE